MTNFIKCHKTWADLWRMWTKCHNIMGQFVTNMRKCHKSMDLVSNMLICDKNIVSVIDSVCLWHFHKTSWENIIDQQFSCSVKSSTPVAIDMVRLPFTFLHKKRLSIESSPLDPPSACSRVPVGTRELKMSQTWADLWWMWKKRHNIMGWFVTNMRKHYKSMGLVSNMLICDENVVSVIDSACLWCFRKTSREKCHRSTVFL
jgi:hypothetical protein